MLSSQADTVHNLGGRNEPVNPSDLDQKYTSIQMMHFEEGSEQMIEEEIELQSIFTPSAANKTSGNYDDFTSRQRTFSQVVSSSNKNAPTGQVRESYNWNIASDQDRSEILSISQSRPCEEDQDMQTHHQREELISETQFDDRDDLYSQSQITEDIFSRGITGSHKRDDTRLTNHDAMTPQPDDTEPQIVKKVALKRDMERYVQSTHDVSKFKHLEDTQDGGKAFDGTGTFEEDAFNLVDQPSAYDLSLQEPA